MKSEQIASFEARVRNSQYPDWIKGGVFKMARNIEQLREHVAMDDFWTEEEIRQAVIRKTEKLLETLKLQEGWTVSHRRYEESDGRVRIELEIVRHEQ